MPLVTANDLSQRIGVEPSQLRGWLRHRQREGDPRLAEHQPGTRWRFAPDLADALEYDYRVAHDLEVEAAPGPAGWWNWQAQVAGRPARETSGGGIRVLPLWEEYALYSDSRFVGSLTAGPAELLLAFTDGEPVVGRSAMQLVLHVHDHLPSADRPTWDYEVENVASYYGGNTSDEFAALLSLALSVRLRSGGLIRSCIAGDDPAGRPMELHHHPPTLVAPQRDPMLPYIAREISLGDAMLLSTYPRIEGSDAVALVRAAQAYADGLWLADADPRLAWIKLMSAVETAANHWKAASFDSPVEQLRRHRKRVYRALRDGDPAVLETVANDLAPTFHAERKFGQFLEEFDPGPPTVRPTMAQVDWTDLEDPLTVLYEYRSGELHAGLPFPGPLCAPPAYAGDIPLERVGGLAVAFSGARWPAHRLPMYLHVFAHLVGGALREWWASLVRPPL